MEKRIGRVVYNTETSTLLCSRSDGEYGDAHGYEEHLYKTKKGKYFVHGVGGTESKYPEADICEISEEDARSQFGVV